MEDKEVIDRLRNLGISITQPRIAIMKYLMTHHTHPNIEEIYHALKDKMPKLSLTTVYNTVNIFATYGAVTFLTIDEKNVCIEENTTPHGHLLCLKCGKTFDLPLQGLSPNTKTLCGHYISEIHQYYKGICSQCLEKEKQLKNNNN